MEYSYETEKSPLPITGYKSTIKVSKEGAGESKVTCESTYTPIEGKDAAAQEAISGIYQAGHDNIQKMAAGS